MRILKKFNKISLFVALVINLIFIQLSPFLIAQGNQNEPLTVRGTPPPHGQTVTMTNKSYCSSIGGSTRFESIKNVTWDTPNAKAINFVIEILLSNPTGCSSGNSWPCPEYNLNPEYVKGWIDWNGDGIWQSHEKVIDLILWGYYSTNYQGTMFGYSQAEIPAYHVEDPIMRVNLCWGCDPDPCSYQWTWGDVRDFTVSIEENCCEYSLEKVSVINGNNPICDIGNSIYPVNNPFSGPLHRELELSYVINGNCPDCPEPIVSIKSNMPLGKTGYPTKGFNGTIKLTTPEKVGIYPVTLFFEIK